LVHIINVKVLLLLFIILLLTFLVVVLVFKAIRKGNLPENNYTPFDDIIEGKKRGATKRRGN
jgi:hypothetical protein